MSKLEYLDENYKLHVIDGENEAVPEGWILVPEGAEIAIKFKSGLHGILFYKENGTHVATKEKGYKWETGSEWTMSALLDESYYDGECDLSHKVLWQRESKSEVVELKGVDAVLAERQSTYGHYEDVAKTTQDILKALRIGQYDDMPNPHKESLHMIASKMARIVHGDCNHLDGWVDIGGYSKLIVNLIEGK